MSPYLWRFLSCDSSTIIQKYPGFADRIHEGLVDIFGEKGRFVLVSSYHSSACLIIIILDNLKGISLLITLRMAVALEVLSLRVRVSDLSYMDLFTYHDLAMTKKRKEAGLYVHL
jgi:hypothetical protein